MIQILSTTRSGPWFRSPTHSPHLSSQQKLCLRAQGGQESLVPPQSNACISLNRCFWPGSSGVCFHYQIYSCTDYHEKTVNPIHLPVTSFPVLNLPSGVAQHLGFWFRSPILLFISQFSLLSVASASIPWDSGSSTQASVFPHRSSGLPCP